MIGNDIVDLKQAASESNWQRKGFVTKIFTQTEQEYIRLAKNKLATLWRLWSMKESAYKINVQQTGKRFFNPKKLQCTFFNDTKGKVVTNTHHYYTVSDVNTAYIYTEASIKHNENTKSTCFKIKNNTYQTQHISCYNRLKSEVSKALKLEQNHITIEKNSFGVPKLFYNKIPLNLFLSITHHGSYGAYVIVNLDSINN